MHDPLTEAFRWPQPFKKHDAAFANWRAPVFVIWHRDPEKDGSDDSCGWAFPKISKETMERLHGNAVEGLCSWDELDQRVIGYRMALRHARPRWKHPRWHVHHWRVQIPVMQRIRRSFERCSKCGERFGWRPGGLVTHGGPTLFHMRHVYDSGTPKSGDGYLGAIITGQPTEPRSGV